MVRSHSLSLAGFGRVLGVVAAGSVLLATAALTAPPAMAKTTHRAAPLTTLVVGIPVTPPKLAHVGVYMAQDMGFFKRVGLNVKIVGFTAGYQALRGTASGYIDIGFGASSDGLAAAAAHSGIVTIWDQTQSLDTVVLANVSSIQQLKGKYVAVNGVPGFAYTQLAVMFRNAHMSIQSVKFVNMQRAAMVSAMVSGRVAAGVFHADDALLAETKDPHLHIINVLYKTLPWWWYGATLVNKNWADSHRSVVVRFLEAMVMADRWMYSHKSEVVKLAAGPTGESPAILASAYNVLKSAQTWTVNTGLYPPDVEETIRNNVQNKVIPHYIAPSSVIDMSFIDAALQKVGRVSWGKP